MEKKIFYRIANNKTEQGLWYDFKGNFTGLIHDKFDFCVNSELPMPYDENVKGWLSATDKLSDMWGWFTKEDILNLEKYGYGLTVYEATEYRAHENHWLIKQESSVYKTTLPISSI